MLWPDERGGEVRKSGTGTPRRYRPAPRKGGGRQRRGQAVSQPGIIDELREADFTISRDNSLCRALKGGGIGSHSRLGLGVGHCEVDKGDEVTLDENEESVRFARGLESEWKRNRRGAARFPASRKAAILESRKLTQMTLPAKMSIFLAMLRPFSKCMFYQNFIWPRRSPLEPRKLEAGDMKTFRCSAAGRAGISLDGTVRARSVRRRVRPTRAESKH